MAKVCCFLVVLCFYLFVYLDQNTKDDLTSIDFDDVLGLLRRKLLKNGI